MLLLLFSLNGCQITKNIFIFAQRVHKQFTNMALNNFDITHSITIIRYLKKIVS